MPIDTSGEYWRGTEAADLDVYLKALKPGGYPVARTLQARCEHDGGAILTVRADPEEGYAERRCVTCGTDVVMLDSEDYAEDATPETATCRCGGEQFEIAAGFAVRDDASVRWVSVGLRCVRDGTLGMYAEWKIDYQPTEHLYERV